jgi:Immunity protein Imm1
LAKVGGLGAAVKKRVYFDVFDGRGWPAPSELEHYFLASPGQRWTFGEGENDCWGLSLEGVDGTEHLGTNAGRINIHLTMIGNPDYGVLLHYRKWRGGHKDTYYSKGDLTRLKAWLWTAHGSLMPMGLFIPFERAWLAVKEFMETDGALPKSIEWIAAADIPDEAFPDPYLVARQEREAAARK